MGGQHFRHLGGVTVGATSQKDLVALFMPVLDPVGKGQDQSLDGTGQVQFLFKQDMVIDPNGETLAIVG